MNLHELNELAGRGEWEQVEFKSTTANAPNDADGLRDVELGGFMESGVTPDGKVVGQTVATSILESIQKHRNHPEPDAGQDGQTSYDP
jgi:hypothetical protein